MKYLFYALTFLLFVVNIYTAEAEASLSYAVLSTVRIPVCGDGVQEFPEDCDNADIGDKTCATLGTGYNHGLGYTEGTLGCDIACDFNPLGCTYTPPPDVKINDDDDDDDADTTTTSTETTTSSTEVPSPIVRELSELESASLPFPLRKYDKNGNGRIELSEMKDSVEDWVAEWRADIQQEISLAQGYIKRKTEDLICDLNFDNRCDLVDFSILMYNIGRS